ncbi:MAG: glycosyltransferase family 4 protein [Xanthomonadales bacterium]|nr:glycosyltransferase family 4 protein [Xanthomonadales bacterium]
MVAATAWPLAVACLGTAVASALLVRLGLAYARRRKLIDQPGQRRSHAVPTPRGGGIGIVVAGVLAMAALAGGLSTWREIGVLAAILAVAVVGWIDDHRGLPAGRRFGVHCLAGGLAVAACLHPAMPLPLAATAVLALLAAAGLVWSINLHNFMDGIDGLLAWQAVFVLLVLAALEAAAGEIGPPRAMLLWAAAVAGFLPFNFPRARIFMGDVGSGALGLVIGIAVLAVAQRDWTAAAAALVACSAFMVDAGCTLLSRMLRGRRWYSAHREHLYQWLVRRGLPHARVVGLYMGWNLFIVLPSILIITRLPAGAAVTLALAIHALAVLLWWRGKQACLGAAGRRRVPCCEN